MIVARIVVVVVVMVCRELRRGVVVVVVRERMVRRVEVRVEVAVVAGLRQGGGDVGSEGEGAWELR
jgi:hypothetical protein